MPNIDIALLDTVIIGGEYNIRRFLYNGEIVKFSVKSMGNRHGVFITESDMGKAEINFSQMGNFFFNADPQPGEFKADFSHVKLKNGRKIDIVPDKVNDFWGEVRGKFFKVESSPRYKYLIFNKEGIVYRRTSMTRQEAFNYVLQKIANKNFRELKGLCKTALKYEFIEI